MNKAGKTVVEAGAKIKKTVEENVSNTNFFFFFFLNIIIPLLMSSLFLKVVDDRRNANVNNSCYCWN